jgi:SAM-dependent methyltransferase
MGDKIKVDEQEQLRLLYEIFDASLPRLGPGDDDSTQRAFRTLLARRRQDTGDPEPGALSVLDIGCGNGAQTIQLALHMEGTLVAVDDHQPFLDELERRARACGVAEKITSRLKDMRTLGSEDGVFDIVWAEGSLYVMGFVNGLTTCRGLLAPGGFLAVSELTWLRPDPPRECREFFAAEYPDMVNVAANLMNVAESGYELVDHFTLPESAWLENYYGPLEARLGSLREECATETEKLEMIAWIDKEIEVYRKYSAYYGYVFYLARRV